MDIFKKRDGPRPEDVRARRLINENAATIQKLADQISNGGYSAMQKNKAKEPPKPRGLIHHDMAVPAAAQDPEPYVRISLNDRVVLACKRSGRQIQLLGEIRRAFPDRKFVIATAERGYITPVSEDVLTAIGHLDEAVITSDFSEKDLAAKLEQCMGLN